MKVNGFSRVADLLHVPGRTVLRAGVGVLLGLCLQIFDVELAEGQATQMRVPVARTKRAALSENSAEKTSEIELTEPATQLHEAIKATTSSIRPKKQMVDELSIGIGQESFLSRKTPPAGIADYNSVSARVRTHADGDWISGYLEFGGSIVPDLPSYRNFEVPEGYLNIETQPAREATIHSRLSLGRKREVWSQLDTDWGLGLWQPLNRFDYLRPTEQGLTGAFVVFAGGGLELVFFGSNVHIPEQMPPFDLEGGKFHSVSPWFSEPAEGVVLFEKTTEVKYHLATPAVSEIVDHGSAGILLRGGSLEQGPFAQVAITRKPRNPLSLPFEANLDLTESSSFATVVVHPRVAYHWLGSFDAGYRSRLFSASLSALREEVQADEVPDHLNYQQLAPVTFLSPKVEGRLFPSRSWGPRVSLSYLQTSGGEITYAGPRAMSNGAIFAPRTPYRHATSVAAEALIFRSRSVRIYLSGRWIEELEEKGTVLMGDLKMHFGNGWRFAFAGDVLGSQLPADQTTTFISHYRGNDRVSSQLSYAF